MTQSERILVAVATYNERENLPSLIDEIRRTLPKADLLVVDDNSPDGTGRWVAERSANDARVRGLHRPGKLGLGSATIAAFDYAIEHRYTFVVTLDADGSHHPKYIPTLLACARADQVTPPDVVIGSRYVSGGRTEGWPVVRRWMSRAVNGYARILLGLPIRDCSGAFRCIRVPVLERVELGSLRSQGYAFFEEILWRLKMADARFAEIPIVFTNRKRGQSKINTREAVTALWNLSRLGIQNWMRI